MSGRVEQVKTVETAPAVGEKIDVRSSRWEGVRAGTVIAVEGTPGNFRCRVNVELDPVADRRLRWIDEPAEIHIIGAEVYEPLSDDERELAAERARNGLLGAWGELKK